MRLTSAGSMSRSRNLPRQSNSILFTRQGMKHRGDNHHRLPASQRSASLAGLQRNVNWDSQKLELYQSPTCGTGVRASESIGRGECVGVFGGHIVRLSDRAVLPPALAHFYYQVSDDLILTHTSLAQVKRSKIEFINHSCEPNVGFNGQIELIAISDIPAEAAVTFDYAFCTSEPRFRLRCFCGTPRCRHYITGDDWKIVELQQNYQDYFQPYLARKIRASQLATSSKLRNGR